MAIVTHNPIEHPMFSQHVHAYAAKAEACLPAAAGRIARAVELVLAGGVEAIGAGKYEVASASQWPDKWYVVRDKTCTCPDYQHRSMDHPDHFCKHVLACFLYRRAVQQIEKEDMMSQDPVIYDTTRHETNPEPAPALEPMPQADDDDAPRRDEPCSATFNVMIQDHAIEIHLADTDDFTLLWRVEHMLTYLHAQHTAKDDSESEDVETVN